MKHPSAYYLLLLYTIAICKPFLPAVRDVLAHTFWTQEHLATIHHQHGAMHLHDELEKAATQEKTDPATNRYPEPLAVHLLTHCVFDFTCKAIPKQRTFRHSCSEVSPFSKPHTPPPKV